MVSLDSGTRNSRDVDIRDSWDSLNVDVNGLFDL